MKFRRIIIPTIFTVPAFILLIILGSWQVHRLNWKVNLIDELKLKASKEVVDLPGNFNIDKMEYRTIKIKGNYLHDKEVHLYGGGRQYKGDKGYFILTPLKTIAGKIIMVNRGMVPLSKKNSGKRLDTLVKGEVEIEAALVKGETQGLMVPDNDLAKNMWFWIDLDGMKRAVKENIEDYYLIRRKDPENNNIPIGKNLNINLRNEHLQYVIIWFSSAMSLLVIYTIYIRRELTRNNKV